MGNSYEPATPHDLTINATFTSPPSVDTLPDRSENKLLKIGDSIPLEEREWSKGFLIGTAGKSPQIQAQMSKAINIIATNESQAPLPNMPADLLVIPHTDETIEIYNMSPKPKHIWVDGTLVQIRTTSSEPFYAAGKEIKFFVGSERKLLALIKSEFTNGTVRNKVNIEIRQTNVQ